jgi:hypothetical protein
MEKGFWIAAVTSGIWFTYITRLYKMSSVADYSWNSIGLALGVILLIILIMNNEKE